MAMLATTATEKEIFSRLENASAVMEVTDFQDMNRSFEENGERFYVFALYTDVYKSEIEAAITKSGKKFKWL